VWAAEGVLPQVRPVPDLFSQSRPRGISTRRDQGELVGEELMTMTDPVSDLITRIRNAHIAKHDRLDMPASELKMEICKVLKEQGFI
jgi:hypothetical protein